MKELEYNPKNSYRVMERLDGDWDVTVYAPNPTKNFDGTFTWGELPQWIKDKIMLLQLAEKDRVPGAHIPTVGEKIANIYWIMAEHLQEKENGEEKIQEK